MTAEQLRKSILQWAIEGKLTKQNPDESASELLDKINLEKEKLIKEKKIKKSDLQDSIIYKDNSDNCYYEKFKDGRVEKIDNELNNQKSLDYKRLHEVVYFDKKFKGVEKDKQRKILKFHHISSNKMKSIDIEKNGIVRLLSTGKLDGYCNISTEKEIVNFGEVISIPTGGSAILKYHHGFFIDSLNILFSSQDPEIYYLKYIYYALLNKVEYIQQCFKGSSIQHPDMKKIIDITIPIPNIEEQKHIVKIIDSLEPFIQKYEKLQNELEILNNNFPTNLEKSIINYAMQGKLVKQDEKDNSVDKLINEIYKEKEKLVKEGKLKNTELKDLIIYKNSDDNSYYEKSAKILANVDVPFEIPDNWRWVKLNNISKIKGGYAFKSNKFSTNGVRIIRISDFNENSIVNTSIKRYPFSNELSSYKINENDILIAMTGGTVGKSILIKRLEEDMYLNQRVCMISPIIVKPYFLHISLRSSYIQDFINRIKTSTNDNISLENIKNFLIPIPPLEEQLRIVENITKIKNLLKTL